MKVPYSYLQEQFSDLEPIFAEMRQLVQRGDFTLGAAVAEFEQKFSAYCGAQFGIGVGTGTDALFLALKALNIGVGDEVITCPNTFVATVGAIVQAGARPVFVDSNDQFVIDASKIEAAITPRTKAIMPVHYSGQPCDMPKIMAIARHHNLRVVEDACQSIGGEINGQRVGSWGDAAGFSLHPLKNLNVWGDGGVITTNSKALRDRLMLLRNHGLKNRDVVEIYGYNSRLDTVQAVIGLWLFPQASAITDSRIKTANQFDRELSQLRQLRLPPRSPNMRHVYHLYMFHAERRDELLQFLLKNGVDAKIHYPIPMHLQPASASLGYKLGDFPITELHMNSVITLPVHQHLTEEQKQYCMDKVREFYQ
ncbi:MAG: dTDP-3-amino-3,6-dideoxy-alpha-D-galactopyranose transaminase [Verrucomicrobiae bacterium]|nr:dTDP-3-amino-3,6-dideoxy-alpha-D-galactopyranose transaminase [Verrucomicrobiae bacterium]